MDRLRQDLVFALRLLHKDRAFAATTILTLALCIGANTAIFTVVRSVLLRPLPYAEADRLIVAYDAFPGAGVERAGTSVPNYLDRVPLTQVFESVALYRFGGLRVGTGQSAEGVTSMEVTPSFFRVLRARAAHGRLLTDDDGQPGRQYVALLSHDFAARLPGGVTGILERELRLNDRPHTVVGVLPADFRFLNPDVRIWTPLAFSAEERAEDARYSQNHELIARLAPGATLAQAQARVDALNAINVQRAGALAPALRDAGYHTRLLPLQADVVRSVRSSLHLLWGGVLFVLLIAGVNITNLALVRASGRLRELATRHALGAAQARVTRQLITETTLLTIIGGAIGLALGAWSIDALSSAGFAEIPRSYEIRIDAVVVASILGMAAVLGVIVGAVPAAQIARLNLSAVLRDEGRSGTAGRGARALRRSLVVAQVALAFVLLVGAGLLLASFQQLLKVDPGFTAEHVLTGRATLLEARYPEMASVRAYTSRALDRIRALPGVEAAGVTTFLPFSLDGDSSRRHSRGLCAGTRRVGCVAERASCDPWLLRSDAHADQARAGLHRERHGWHTACRHRRRTAGQAVLGRRRSDRPPDVPTPAAGGSRETRSRLVVAAGGRGRGHRQTQGPDRGGGRPYRRLLLPLRAGRAARRRVCDPHDRRPGGRDRRGPARAGGSGSGGAALRRAQHA